MCALVWHEGMPINAEERPAMKLTFTDWTVPEGTAIVPFDPVTSRPFPLPEGSQDRKDIPLWEAIFRYFPNAFVEMAKVSKFGNDKHNPGEPLHWDRGKSMDQANCVARHMYDAEFGYRDKDGMFHLAYALWRIAALCQIELEREHYGYPHPYTLLEGKK